MKVGFQMVEHLVLVLTKWQPFVWISNGWAFRISDPIQKPDRLQPNLFLTIQNPDKSGFQIPTVLYICLAGSTVAIPIIQKIPNPNFLKFGLGMVQQLFKL